MIYEGQPSIGKFFWSKVLQSITVSVSGVLGWWAWRERDRRCIRAVAKQQSGQCLPQRAERQCCRCGLDVFDVLAKNNTELRQKKAAKINHELQTFCLRLAQSTSLTRAYFLCLTRFITMSLTRYCKRRGSEMSEKTKWHYTLVALFMKWQLALVASAAGDFRPRCKTSRHVRRTVNVSCSRALAASRTWLQSAWAR